MSYSIFDTLYLCTSHHTLQHTSRIITLYCITLHRIASHTSMHPYLHLPTYLHTYIIIRTHTSIALDKSHYIMHTHTITRKVHDYVYRMTPAIKWLCRKLWYFFSSAWRLRRTHCWHSRLQFQRQRTASAASLASVQLPPEPRAMNPKALASCINADVSPIMARCLDAKVCKISSGSEPKDLEGMFMI